MMLLTKANRKALPPLYSQENNPDPIVQVKFFDPTGSFTWFAYEFDGEDLFFGKVFSSMCPDGEIGYFRLSELETCKQGMPQRTFAEKLKALPIERDKFFTPKPLSQITRTS